MSKIKISTLLILFTLLMSGISINAYAQQSISPLSWTTDTVNNASATVTGNDVALRVYQTSWASATAYLGNLNGSLTTNFDFTRSADSFWEDNYLSYVTNGSQNFSIPGCSPSITSSLSNCGINPLVFTPNVSGLVNSSISNTISVSGETYVVFANTPSWASGNGDHANTYLNISNLVINYTPSEGGIAPEMNASLIPQVGLLLGCLFLMFGRKRVNTLNLVS